MRPSQFSVGLLSYKIIGWVCVVFFLGCSIGAYFARQYGPITIFMFFVLMGVYMIVSAGSYTLNDESVTHTNVFGSFHILWQNVRQIEVGTQGTLVLHGNDQRFILAPATFWSGRDKPEAFALLTKKIEDLDITPYPSNVADYKIHKNVRV